MDWSVFLPPYESVELPSKGKFYKNSKNEDLKSGWVQIRQYAAPEEALIAQINVENSQRMINSILSNCLKGVEVGELTDEDTFYLLIWLRANSYSPQYELTVFCPYCNIKEPQTHVVDLSELKIHYLEKEIKEPLEKTLPRSKLVVHLNTLRRSKVIQAQERVFDVKKYQETEGDPYVLLKRAYSISKIITPEGEEVEDRLQIESLCLNYLSSYDSLFIDEALEKFNHGVDTRLEIKCVNCEEIIRTSLPASSDQFFRPYSLSLHSEGEHVAGDTTSVESREDG